MYRYFNPNPFLNNNTGDCVVRGLCMLTGDDWDSGDEAVLYYWKKET